MSYSQFHDVRGYLKHFAVTNVSPDDISSLVSEYYCFNFIDIHSTQEIWQKQWKMLIKCDKNIINNEDDILTYRRQEL